MGVHGNERFLGYAHPPQENGQSRAPVPMKHLAANMPTASRQAGLHGACICKHAAQTLRSPRGQTATQGGPEHTHACTDTYLPLPAHAQGTQNAPAACAHAAVVSGLCSSWHGVWRPTLWTHFGLRSWARLHLPFPPLHHGARHAAREVRAGRGRAGSLGKALVSSARGRCLAGHANS